jgi:hypothetical protein
MAGGKRVLFVEHLAHVHAHSGKMVPQTAEPAAHQGPSNPQTSTVMQQQQEQEQEQEHAAAAAQG